MSSAPGPVFVINAHTAHSHTPIHTQIHAHSHNDQTLESVARWSC